MTNETSSRVVTGAAAYYGLSAEKAGSIVDHVLGKGTDACRVDNLPALDADLTNSSCSAVQTAFHTNMATVISPIVTINALASTVLIDRLTLIPCILIAQSTIRSILARRASNYV